MTAVTQTMDIRSLTGQHTVSSNVRKLQEAINFQFSDLERRLFVSALNQYHLDRDVVQFLTKVRFVLISPNKQHLVPMIRKVIPRSDVEAFDNYIQGIGAYGSLPIKRHQKSHHLQETLSTREFLLRPQEGNSKVRSKKRSKPNKRKSALTTKLWHSKSVPGSNSSTLTKSSFSSYNGSQSTLQPMENKILHLHINLSPHIGEGFGFSIRGGSQYGLGIYVSVVDGGGQAERQGLLSGDLIMVVNDISFKQIGHDEAAKVVKAAKQLDILVCRVGCIPGSHDVHLMYRWVDTFGHTVTAPPALDIIQEAEMGTLNRKTGFMLLKGPDEKKLTVIVDQGQKLGLLMRGGLEFALGIYVSGVDQGSVAEQTGIKVGDQILNVNGQSFLDITHGEAVHILTTTRVMIMTIKDVGKLPYTKIRDIQADWLSASTFNRFNSASRASTSSSQRTSSTLKASVSSRKSGSIRFSDLDTLEGAAKHELNYLDQRKFHQYLNQYQKRDMPVSHLVDLLKRLLNTHSKFSLMSHVRGIIQPNDRRRFDMLVSEKEELSRQARPIDFLDGSSLSSVSANSSVRSRRKERNSLSSNEVLDTDGMESLMVAIEQIEDNYSDGVPNDLPQDDVMDYPTSFHIPHVSHLLSSSSSSTLTDTDRPASPTMHQFTHNNSFTMEEDASSRRSALSDNVSTEIDFDDKELGLAAVHKSKDHAKKLPKSKCPPSSIYSQSYNGFEIHGDISDMHGSIQDVRTDKGKHNNKGSYRPIHHQSLEDVRSLQENFLLKRATSIPATISTTADIHHHSMPLVNHSSDDSGVEVSGGNHDDSQYTMPHSNSPSLRHKRVTISDNTVDIEDAMSARSSISSIDKKSIRSKTSNKQLKFGDGQQSKSEIKDQKLHPHWSAKSSAKRSRSRPPLQMPDKSKGRSRSVSPAGSKGNSRNTLQLPRKSLPSVNNSSFLSNLANRIQGRTLTPYMERSERQQGDKSTRGSYDVSAGISAGAKSVLDLDEEATLIENARENYGNVHLEIIPIYKTKPTLGLAVEGGVNTGQPIPRVINIQPGGSAHASGRLRVGHVILEVNGQCLAGMQHLDAARTIAEAFKQAGPDGVELLVTDKNVNVNQT